MCTVYRIQAITNFGRVKSGDLGGWVQSEKNLSQDGLCWVTGNTRIDGNAHVKKTSDVLVVGPLGSRNSHTTFYKGRDDQIYVHCGCFLDTIDKFTDKVISTHGEHKHRYVYEAAINLTKLQINMEDKK